MEKSSIWITWGTANEGAFILVDIFCCHFNSDTVSTATTNGHMHPSDTVQILSLQTLMRCSWNQPSWSNLSGPCWVSGEKEMLKDRTGLAVSLLPGEWAPSLYWYHALDWIFLLTLCRHRSCCRFIMGFLHGWTRNTLKKAEKSLHFPNGVKSKWTHFSCWIILGFAWLKSLQKLVAMKSALTTETCLAVCSSW